MTEHDPSGKSPRQQNKGRLASVGSSARGNLKRLVVRFDAEHFPLFKERPILDSRQSPWHGLILEKYHHGGCEIPAHDHEAFCLHFQTGGQVEMDWFCSGRSGRERSVPGSMMMLPV